MDPWQKVRPRAAPIPAVWTALWLFALATPAAAQVLVRAMPGYGLELLPLNDPTCPDEKWLREEILSVLGHRDALDPRGPHFVRVTVRKPKRYEAIIELVLPDGRVVPDSTRRMDGTSCKNTMFDAATAAANLIPLDLSSSPKAKTIDPPVACDDTCRDAYERGRAAGRKEREQEIIEELDEKIDERLKARGLSPGPPVGHAPPMTMPFAVSAGGLISIGYTLDVAPGFAVGAEWRPAEVFLLSAEARVALPTAAVIFGSTGPQDIGIYSLLIAPCARYSYFLGCAALDAGVQHWVGFGTERGSPAGDWGPWVALGPRLGVDVPFAERFSVRVTGDLLFPLLTTELFDPTVQNADVYKSPIVTGFVTAGLTVAF